MNKNYQISILIILILLTFLTNLFAEDSIKRGTDIQFERISVEQGLSQSVIFCILQDNQGFMWFGTQDGLNKYDGYTFKVYNHIPENPNSLSHNSIYSIYEDNEGFLWIATAGGGLDKFNKETEEFVHYNANPDDPNSLSNDNISAIYEDKQGTLWIVASKEINRFDRENDNFIIYPKAPIDTTSSHAYKCKIEYESVLTYEKDTIWKEKDYKLERKIETPQGYYKFDRESNKFSFYQSGKDSTRSWSRQRVIQAFYEDKAGILWIGTGKGLSKYDKEKDESTYYINDPANPNSLSNNTVLSIYEDKSGVMWIATWFGLNKFDKEKRKFTHYKQIPNNLNSLSHNFIWSFCEDSEDILWIGSVWGLNKFDREKGEITHYQSDYKNKNNHKKIKEDNKLSNNVIYKICEDHTGILWIGTAWGLNKFDRETEKFTYYIHDDEDSTSLSNNLISSIYEDSEGTLWIGTAWGLNKFDRETETFVHYKNIKDNPNSLTNNTIKTIYEDNNGILWIGTIMGLNKFDKENELFTRYEKDPNNPNKLHYNFIQTLYEDQENMLWIGTFGEGFYKFDKDKETFTYYREEDGLPNNVVYGILGDTLGNLWLSTNNGLSKFNIKEETFKNYDTKDGLQSNEFNSGAYYRSKSGEMFFGGINGFNAFYPDDIKDNPYPPSVIITDFKIFNKSVKLGIDSPLKKSITETKEITLSYKQNNLSFEFVALHYSCPEKNQYAYMMEGFDKEWVHIGTRRFAIYSNLPNGKYTFRVIASNNDGVWNKTGTTIKIIITPPFWETWWFYTLEILLGISLLACAFLYQRKYHQHQKEEALTALDLKRKTEELEYARQVQISMLPKTNLILEKIQIIGKMVTATEVGGDYYDFIKLEDNRYCIVIGDATGHGVAAGLVVGMLKASLASLLKIFPKQILIKELIENLNIALKESVLQRNMGMSLELAIINIDDLSVELGSAGMPFPYYYNSQTGKLSTLIMQAPPLGFLKHIDVQTRKMQLQAGDILIFLSDGFEERMDIDDEIWGDEALQKILTQICNEEHQAEQITERLIAACDEFADGRENQDDMTIVIILIENS